MEDREDILCIDVGKRNCTSAAAALVAEQLGGYHKPRSRIPRYSPMLEPSQGLRIMCQRWTGTMSNAMVSRVASAVNGTVPCHMQEGKRTKVPGVGLT